MKYCETSLLWSSIEKPLFFGCNQRKSILFLTVHYWEGGFGGWWGVLGGRFLNIETGSPVIRLLLGWILRTFGALGGCPVPNTFNYPSFLYSPSVTVLYFNTVIELQLSFVTLFPYCWFLGAVLCRTLRQGAPRVLMHFPFKNFIILNCFITL